MTSVRESLLSAVRSRVLVGDGAMGTQLIEAGLPVGGCGDQWVLTQPDKVRFIQSAYVQMGADVLLTNTFQASPLALVRHGLADKAYDINLAAARLARDCVGSRGYVLGDIGPFGGYLEPLGNTTRTELSQSASVQTRGLADGGVDAVIIETMTSLEELDVVISAARHACPNMVLVASVSFDRVADGGFRTMTGASVRDVVDFLVRKGVDVLGCNCGTGLHAGDYVQLVSQYRSLTDRPIMVQPNAGQPRLERGRIAYDETPEIMAAAVPAIIAAGANIVGGCCGTTPEHVQQFRRVVDQRR